MYLLDELRHPTRWYSKLLTTLLAVGFFSVLAAAVISGFIVYRILAPAQPADAPDLANFPGHPENVSYNVDGIGPRESWFFPGLKSAPTIVLCPGYRMSRGELLPLATALQDHQYNVFLFDFTGKGWTAGHSTLGFREVAELRAAVSVLARRDDVDASRFGLWGMDMGGYAALALAESDPRVRAVVVESVYDSPRDMARLLVDRDGSAPLPLLEAFAERSFMWVNYSYRGTPPLSARLPRLNGVSTLFLGADDDRELLNSTHQLFLEAPEPKEEDVLERGDYAGMLDEDKRSYENRIVSFFLLHLPAQVNSRP
jgi:pimeloyl-ACP methyl ester carboxylesterase